MQSRSRWVQRRSWVSSRTRFSAGGDVDLEMAPDRVADAPFQGPERFLLRLALDEFAFVVDASGGVVGDLSDRDEMQRMVQFAVPARVQPMPLAGAAGRFDRCGAVVGREPFRCGEPGRVTDVG